MSKKAIPLLIILSLLLPTMGWGTGNPPYVPGQVIVTTVGEKGPAVTGAPSRLFLSSRRRGGEKTFLVTLPPGQSVEEALVTLKNSPGVVSAQPNFIYQPAYIPSDPSFNQQWALHNRGQSILGISGKAGADISAPSAWDMTFGSPDIVVAVIDTGVAYDHPDLTGSIWNNPGEVPGNDLDDDGNGLVDDLVGWDFEDGDPDPWDPHGHGTHVAGIIAAKMDNGMGIAGVAPGSRIMVLKAGGVNGYFSTYTLVNSIDYAISKGARIINASWGGYSVDPLLKDAIDRACQAGILFVAAAGNQGTNNDSIPFYPASYDLPCVVSVASTDSSDELSSFSNYGENSVDVAAPGELVISTGIEEQVVTYVDFPDTALPPGWTTGGTGNTWGICSEKFLSPGYSLCDSPGGNYGEHVDSHAELSLDLTGKHGTFLRGYLRGSARSGAALYVEAGGGGLWKTREVELLNGTSKLLDYVSGNLDSSWNFFRVDLGLIDGSSGGFRFRFLNDSTVTGDGWYFDDLEVVTTTAPSGDLLVYMSGTSMAAPVVSGVGALILSRWPDLKPEEVKDLIVLTSDILPGLTGKVRSGGRVNAFRALTGDLNEVSSVPPHGGGGGCSIGGGGTASPLPLLAVFSFLLIFSRTAMRKR